MNNDILMIEALELRAKRRDSRRSFLQVAGGAAAAIAGASVLSACGSDNNNNGGGGGSGPGSSVPPPPPPPPPPPIGDADILNFALNLEYLEAEFYSYAVFGTGLPANLRTGTGVQGVTSPGSQVAFTDASIAQYAREIAEDEIAHVRFLRAQLGAATVAAPDMDVSGSASGAFTAAARAAGVVGPTGTFNPYANQDNFLLGAFIFEDVGVTAYKGASPLLTSKVFLEAAAGILAAEAYHAGLVRTILFGRGIATPSLRTSSTQISNARDSLDGPLDIDQGVVGTPDASNIVPNDANGIVYSRSAGQVLNIVYLNRNAVTGGGFFPTGTNGTIRVSAAN